MAEPGTSLLRKAQEGDEEALVELVLSQQTYIYSIALNVVGQPADAADVSQDVVMKLMKGLSSYRAETKFTTWLYRLAYNAAVDDLRKRGRASSLEEDLERHYDRFLDSDPDIDPVVAAERGETARRVRDALTRLPPVQRAALTMYYFEDMTYEAMAEALDLPLNTLKSHLHRAKASMARELAEAGGRDAMPTYSRA